MSKYTTGEIAKLCNVSVRTVQYYDDRKILVPTELSEGGRRLYSENDLKRMKIICFLRDAGFPISSISALLNEKEPSKIISILIEEQERSLRYEIQSLQEKLDVVEGIKNEIKDLKNFSVESIEDIAIIMKQKSKLKKLRWFLVLAGIPVTALQLTSIILWITNGLWWLFPIWALSAVIYGVIASVIYYKSVAYICPECHNIFKPKFKEMFWAYHTPRMRRLTCPKCEFKGLCVEIYDKKENN